MNLFKISKEYLQLLDELEEREGELTPEIEQKLAINESQFETKVEGYVALIRKLQSDIETARDEEKRISKIRKSRENLVERLKSNLDSVMQMKGEDRYDAPTFKLSYRKSKQVRILDEEQIPEEYLRIKVEPSKSEIKKLLDSGEVVDWAKIVENKNLQIR